MFLMEVAVPKRHLIATAGIVLFGLSVALARAETLNLDQCVRAALAENVDLAASQSRIRQADAAQRQAESARLPSVGLSLTASRTNDALGVLGMKLGQRTANPAIDFAPEALNNPGDLNNLNTRIEIRAPIYTGGLLGSQVEQGRAGAAAARQGDEAARQQVIQQVLTAYQGVHSARAYIKVALEAQAASEEYVRVTEKLHREGVAIKSDLLSARVHLEDARLRLAEARRLEADALDRLKILMGRSLADQLDVGPESLPAMPEGDEVGLRQKALGNHPLLKALRSQVDVAQAKIEAARAGRRPQLSLLGRQDWNDNRLGLDASSYTVAGVFSWTLYDGGVAGGTIDQARAAHEEATARLRQAENEVSLGVAESRRQALEAESRVAARELAVAQAEEAQRLVRKRYENGLTTMLDLLTGQVQLDRARAELVAARRDLILARAALRQAIGMLTVEHL